MKGYYSLGLCGYEVWITDKDAQEEKIHWQFVPDGEIHRTKIYETVKGRFYFLAPTGRIHLDECLRA